MPSQTPKRTTPPSENVILNSYQSCRTVPYVLYLAIVRRTMWVRTCVRDNTVFHGANPEKGVKTSGCGGGGLSQFSWIIKVAVRL